MVVHSYLSDLITVMQHIGIIYRWLIHTNFIKELTTITKKEITYMRFRTDVACSLGFLAGTTFGSGIGFLFRWQGYDTVISVAVCGILGVLVGVFTCWQLNRRYGPTPGT